MGSLMTGPSSVFVWAPGLSSGGDVLMGTREEDSRLWLSLFGFILIDFSFSLSTSMEKSFLQVQKPEINLLSLRNRKLKRQSEPL